MTSKHIILGYPVSPSKHVSKKMIPVHKILISYGGGMGGANRTYYATGMVERGNRTVIDTIEGVKDVVLNQDFIVSIEKGELCEIVTDATEHWNFHDKANPKYKKVITKQYFYVPQTYTVEYNHQSLNGDTKPVYQENEMEKK